MNKHSRPGERNDHQALTHQTTLPPGRETNGKPAPGPRAIPRNLPQAWLHALAERPEPETSTPGTSKRPRVAQEGKRIEANRHQGKRPEERMGLLDSTIQTRHRQSGGRTPSRKLQEETTRRGEPLQNPDQEPWSDNDSKGKGKGKREASPQAAALATHKGSRQPSGNRGGRTPKGEQPLSPLRAKPHLNIREAAVPEETRQVQDELNRRPANAATLNLNEAKSSKSKSLGDRASR